MSQRIEQRGFSGIGISDKGYTKHIPPGSCPALHFALPLHSVQPLAKHLDSLAEQTPVRLKLSLAGAAQADTTFLALQVSPSTHKPRRKMIKLCQLHLQLTLRTLCPLSKDIKDQTRSIDNTALQGSLEISLLRRRQGVVKDDQLRLVCRDFRRDLQDLPLTRKSCGIRALPSPCNQPANLGTGRLHQQTNLFKTLVKFP